MRLPQKTRAPDSPAPTTPKDAVRANGYTMDNSFMVGLSAQRMLQDRMDTTANNLANLTTAGFKAEALVMRKLSEKPAMAKDIPNEIDFVDAWQLQRDFSTGPMEQTGNPLDMAIEGEASSWCRRRRARPTRAMAGSRSILPDRSSRRRANS